MTISEFLDEFKKQAAGMEREFYLSNRCIRNHEGRCPICWLGTKLGKNPSNQLFTTGTVSSLLGLKTEDRLSIEQAADGHYNRALSPELHELRQQLISACNLKE